jgi:hypothetical protein
MKACGVKPSSSRKRLSAAACRISSVWELLIIITSSWGTGGTTLLDPATAGGSGASGSCDFFSSWSGLFSSSGKSRKGATSARKRAYSNPSESISTFVDDEDVDDEDEVEAEDNEDGDESEGGVEGPFAHGQHVIFGIAHAGGPGGVGSWREEGGNLSWRRLDTRDEREGTKRKPSSWGRGGLSRKSGHPAGWM